MSRSTRKPSLSTASTFLSYITGSSLDEIHHPVIVNEPGTGPDAEEEEEEQHEELVSLPPIRDFTFASIINHVESQCEYTQIPTRLNSMLAELILFPFFFSDCDCRVVNETSCFDTHRPCIRNPFCH